MDIEKIKKMSTEYRKKHNIIVPFDDAYELVYRVKGHVRESNKIKDDSIGSIRKYGSNSFWITLNSKIPEPYKIVAEATLIGCLYLHTNYDKGTNKTTSINKTLSITNEMFMEGHIFAKEILMPEYLFVHYFSSHIENGTINLMYLAQDFKLPVPIIKERALDLNLIKESVPKENISKETHKEPADEN